MDHVDFLYGAFPANKNTLEIYNMTVKPQKCPSNSLGTLRNITRMIGNGFHRGPYINV